MNVERLMALDIGEKRIGIAVSDLLGVTAQGVGVYNRVNNQKDLAYLTELFRQYECTGLVIGLPHHLSGELGTVALRIMKFGKRLGASCGVEPVFWDERLTTVQAERALLEGNLSRKRRRQIIDQLAAQLILDSYLNYRRTRQNQDW
ncbi:MAG: Holliday junction resolvase RuvX [Firmicutes bacterium]|nr:Holliday junction resolvase RuvX [Bacillota bacterium]